MSKELHAAKREVERWDVECRLRGEVLEEPLRFTDEMVEAQLELGGCTCKTQSETHLSSS